MAQRIKMVDISKKTKTVRVAVASVTVKAPASVIKKIKSGLLAKGDCLLAAQAAGIMAAKNTPSIIPLCHPLVLTHVGIDFKFSRSALSILATVKAHEATGVEMEALTACGAAALTIYDMAKPETQGIVITDLKLLKKRGGKSDYVR